VFISAIEGPSSEHQKRVSEAGAFSPQTSPLEHATGQVSGERAHVAFACAAMQTLVEVDPELGTARALWIGTAQDVGTALNPTAVRGQIEGGAAQGLGLALTEELLVEDGQVLNGNFGEYRIPAFPDVPAIAVELVEEPEPGSPFGVKGVGEPPTVVATAAVLGGLRNASGRDLGRVPVRPSEILQKQPTRKLSSVDAGGS
jgi:CO/xanthine dehydrogenase Mo-binding subunit